MTYTILVETVGTDMHVLPVELMTEYASPLHSLEQVVRLMDTGSFRMWVRHVVESGRRIAVRATP